eukprot:CAMPEP_0176113052 /NCGR_PEP_ID=MMETSP0120_2-20121206/56776_1 /TAXON_ID=160619 /ORGANISM="Kryptoperidinium foliaceum, Strain CCMP 1326" /LENGTH=193 /DNA_ID=CAMNT_0017447285 /DNA_START=671 /DNA_END=1252 /DNA_ORIENTATION=+
MNVSSPMRNEAFKSDFVRSPATQEFLPRADCRIISKVGQGRSGSAESWLRTLRLKPLRDLGGRLIGVDGGGFELVAMPVESQERGSSSSSLTAVSTISGATTGCGTARGPNLATLPATFTHRKCATSARKLDTSASCSAASSRRAEANPEPGPSRHSLGIHAAIESGLCATSAADSLDLAVEDSSSSQCLLSP